LQDLFSSGGGPLRGAPGLAERWKGGHRIRHYGLLASGVKADNLALARKLLGVAPPKPEPDDIASDPATPVEPCPCCGSAMRIIEVFKAGEPPRHRPTAMPAAIRIDTS
jgi:hypothetical protein